MPNRLTTFFKRHHQMDTHKIAELSDEALIEVNGYIAMANTAVEYARSQILKIFTSLETNNLSEDRKIALLRGTHGSIAPKFEGVGVRDLTHEVRESIEKMNDAPHVLALQELKQINTITSKYSLGNCYELALQSLEYILEAYPNMRAELYSIRNGDHVFLVLNRAYYSKPHLPETWGESAVICDPWANKSYSAREAYGTLKNYYRDRKRQRNTIEYFNPKKHRLTPDDDMNTDVLRLNAPMTPRINERLESTPQEIEHSGFCYKP